MTVYIVCKPMGMIYAVHEQEADAIEDAHRRNTYGNNLTGRTSVIVEKWHVLAASPKAGGGK